jgi:hypothetical protein
MPICTGGGLLKIFAKKQPGQQQCLDFDQPSIYEGSLFCFVLFCSIFKHFCTASPNIMEPSPCTHPRRELSKDTKNSI